MAFNEIKTYYCSDEILDEIFNKNYKILNLIDKGSFSEVFEIINLKNNLIFIVKVMIVDEILNTIETVNDEIKILSSMNNDYIIKLYEVFRSDKKFLLIMEKADGNIKDLLKKINLNEKNISKIFYQILLGIKYLHDNNIVHRDIKLQNIMYICKNCKNSKNKSCDEYVDNENIDQFINNIQIKIIDFGLSTKISPIKNYKKDTRLNELWGTKQYFAPEMYLHKYGRQVDIWALGCLLYEMITGKLAFIGKEVKLNFLDKVFFSKKRIFEYENKWINLDDDTKKFIKKMLKISPIKRYDIYECANDFWILKYNQS